jgi:hypothetical protein
MTKQNIYRLVLKQVVDIFMSPYRDEWRLGNILLMSVHANVGCVKMTLTNYLHGLWNPEVQCRIHKGSPIIPILSRINPFARISLRSILILSSHLRLGLTKNLFPVGLSVKMLKAPLPSSMLYRMLKLKQSCY